MHFQFNVAPPGSDGKQAPPPEDPNELLRQLLHVQREQVELLRTLVAMQDGMARWRAMVTRWRDEFPRTSAVCKKSTIALERAYMRMIADLNERLAEEVSEDGLENEFTLNEFLDRYGIRLSQLGTLLNLLTPLAEAVPGEE